MTRKKYKLILIERNSIVRQLGQIIILTTFLGLITPFCIAQQVQFVVEIGNLSEIQLKPFVYIDIADQDFRDRVQEVIFKDRNGFLVTVNEASSADFIIAFIPKSSDFSSIAINSISNDHNGLMIVYRRTNEGQPRILWIEKTGKKANDAVNEFISALKEDRKKPVKKTPASPGDGSAIESASASIRPTILYKENAKHNQVAKDNGIRGTVVLIVVFGEDGKLANFKVVKGLPYGLTASAIQAAATIRFKPAIRNGKPISVRAWLEFTF